MPQSMSGFCGKLISFVKGKYCGIFFFHMKLFKNWGEMVGVFFLEVLWVGGEEWVVRL